jgi:hypothetical protein
MCRLLIGLFKIKFDCLNTNLTLNINLIVFGPFEVKNSKKINFVPHPPINIV